MNLGGMPPPYWLGSNAKLCVKNRAVTVSHLKSLHQFVPSVEVYYMQHDSSVQSCYIADSILGITFVPDHIHLNGLNQIDVFVYAWPHAKNQLHT